MPKQSADLSTALVTSLWNLTQGLITNVPPTQIPPNATPQTSNVYGFEGKLFPRNGWSLAFAATPFTGTSVYGIYEHMSFSGTPAPVRTPVCMTLDNVTSAVKFYEWTGAVWVDRTGSASLTGYAIAPYTPSFANFKGTLYFTTGNDGLYSFVPGSNIAIVTNTDPTLAPYDQPKLCLSWAGRLFIFNCLNASAGEGGGISDPPRAAWSDFLDAVVWQGNLTNGGSSGFQDLYYGDDASDPIVATMDFSNYVLVFKPRSMYLGIETNVSPFFQFTPLFRDIGCVAQNTLRRFQETAFWLGYDNVYMIQGQNQPVPIGNPIRTHLGKEASDTQLGYANAWIDPIRQLYHLWIPGGGGEPNLLFTYNIIDNTWWEGSMADANITPICSYNIWNNPFNVQTFCGSRDGNVYLWDPTALLDNATKFTCSWNSKVFDAQSLFKGLSTFAQGLAEFETMHIQKLALMADSGAVKVALKYGPSLDLMFTTSVQPLDFRGEPSDRFLTFDKGDRFVQLVITWPNIAKFANLQGLTMHVMPRGSVK